jgi:hypothetical protein
MSHTIEYCEIVRAAHDTATKLLNRGAAPDQGRYAVAVDTAGGQTAAVRWHGNRVNMSLPSFKPETRLTRGEADRIVGFIAHECCHVLHSSWNVWRQATALGPQIARLTNGIEDVRIEAAEIATGYLPNLRNVLSETLNAKHFEAVTGRRAQNLPPVGNVAADLSYVLCVLGRLANGYKVPSAANLRRDIAPRFQPIVAYALKRIPRLRDTRGALKLAQEIAQRLAALPPAQQPQPPQPPQDAPGEPQDGPGEASEAGEAQDGPGEPQDSPGEAGEGSEAGEAQDGPGEPQDDPGEAGEGSEAGEAQDGPGEPQDSPGAPGQKNPGDDTFGETPNIAPDDNVPAIEPDANLDNLIRNASERTGDAAASPDLSPLNTFAGGDRMTLPDCGETYAATYAAQLRSLCPRPAKLRTQVAQIIRSQERHGHERFRSVGRMDRRALARIATGAANVYTRRTFVAGVDTAVVILIDGSGSMSSMMPLAHLMALHLAEAIEAARGKVCIAGFWGGRGNVTLALAKGFADKFNAGRLAGLDARLTTPLSVSILAAADLLREVHADRKIVLTLTDGECDLGPATVRAAVAMVTRRGIECAGIGICEDVSYAFPVNATVSDPVQLATEGLATLVRAIETGRNAHR